MTTKTLRTIRRIGICTVVALSAFSLAACSTNAPAASSADDSVKGTLSLLAGSGPQTNAAWAAVNAAFEAKYPNAKVQFSAVPNNNLASTESARIAAGTLDLDVITTPLPVPSYVSNGSESDDVRRAASGGFVNLTSDASLKQLSPSIVKASSFDGKNYVFTAAVSYYTGVYYNKSIFKKYGLSVPTTWDQFLAVCKTLKASGVTPIGIGGKDVWPAGLIEIAGVQGLYPSVSARAALAKNIWSNTTKLTDPTPVSVLQRVKTVYDNAQPNFAGVGYASIPSEFTAGSFAMTVDGTWDQPVIAAAAKLGFSYGYFPLPTSSSATANSTLGGKLDASVAIPSNSKNIKLAKLWLSVLADPKVYAKFTKLAGFIPTEPNTPTSSFITSIGKYTKTFDLAWDQTWVPNSKAGNNAIYPFNYPGLAPMGTASSAAGAAASAAADWAAAFK